MCLALLKYTSVKAINWLVLLHSAETLSDIFSLPRIYDPSMDYEHGTEQLPEDIKSGFQKCRISPFNRNIFSDAHFLCSSVSDRPPLQLNTISRDQRGSPGACSSIETY